MNFSFRAFLLCVGVLSSWPSLAAALIESATGSVTAESSAVPAAQVSVSQRILPGTTIATGPRSRAILRFDDGQVVAISENSAFKVSEYSFSASEPSKDRFVFDLLKGALRSVSSLITSRTPGSYALHTPTATIGVRGTDFMVATVNPTFMSVLNGTITAANSSGIVAFGAGATATVASTTTLATTIAASALPASVAAAFSQLGSIVVSTAGATGTAGAGSGAGAATGAAVGGLGAGAIVGIAAGVGAVAASASSKDNNSGTSGTTGTTGTR